MARDALAAGGPVDAVGITNQRASTVVWDRATGEAVGPGIGWQDLRTAGTCLMLQSQGLRLAPNASATKLAYLLDTYDYNRERDLAFGTVDTWIIWHLSGGQAHVTDASNAGVTGLHDRRRRRLVRPGAGRAAHPEVGPSHHRRLVRRWSPAATALPGGPPITGMAGDQQASLIGQGCTRPGQAKATFGTGAMLDVCVGGRPAFDVRGDGGCFPIVAWRRAGAGSPGASRRSCCPPGPPSNGSATTSG